MFVYFVVNQKGQFLVKEPSTYNSLPRYSDDWMKAKMYRNMSTAKSMVTRNSSTSDKLKVVAYQLCKNETTSDVTKPLTKTIVINQNNQIKNYLKNIRPLTKTLV